MLNLSSILQDSSIVGLGIPSQGMLETSVCDLSDLLYFSMVVAVTSPWMLLNCNLLKKVDPLVACGTSKHMAFVNLFANCRAPHGNARVALDALATIWLIPNAGDQPQLVSCKIQCVRDCLAHYGGTYNQWGLCNCTLWGGSVLQ